MDRVPDESVVDCRRWACHIRRWNVVPQTEADVLVSSSWSVVFVCFRQIEELIIIIIVIIQGRYHIVTEVRQQKRGRYLQIGR